jgi:hypothetical protein
MRADILFPALGLLLAALGYPLARRRVRPNRWYGLRVPATFASERVWFEANAVAGRDLILLGSAVGIAGLLLPLAGSGSRPTQWPAAGVSVWPCSSTACRTAIIMTSSSVPAIVRVQFRSLGGMRRQSIILRVEGDMSTSMVAATMVGMRRGRQRAPADPPGCFGRGIYYRDRAASPQAGMSEFVASP